MKWKSFVIGLVIGFICGALALSALNNRYTMQQSKIYDVPVYVKMDRLTGKTWVLRVSWSRGEPKWKMLRSD